MKKIQIITAAVAITLLAATKAFCYTADVTRNAAEGTYTISGAVPEAVTHILSIAIMPVGSDEFVFASTEYTDAAGNFSCTFKATDAMNAPDNIIKIGSVGMTAIPKSISIVTPSQIDTALGEIRAAESPSSLSEVLIRQKSVLGFDTETKNIPTDGDITAIAALMYPQKEIYTQKHLYGCYLPAAAVAMLDSAPSDKIYDIYKEFYDYCGIKTLKAYPIISGEGTDVSVICADIVKADIGTMEKLHTALNEAAVLYGISNAYSYGDIINIMDTYAEVIPFDLSYFSSNKTNVSKALVGKDFHSMNALENAISAVGVATQKGTGGGGFGSSVSTYKAEPMLAEKPQSKDFSDMTGYEWASTAVKYLSEKNVINGYENGTFLPQNGITREEFVKITVAAFSLYNSSAKSEFSDIPEEHWAYNFVSSAYENGIVSGISADKFGAGEYITRQDIAVILNNAMKNTESDSNAPFSDDDAIADYARTAVYTLRRLGIINGFENNTFLPQKNATRAEAAVMVYKALSEM